MRKLRPRLRAGILTASLRTCVSDEEICLPLPLVKAEEVVEPWYLEDGVVLPGILGVISF